MTDLEIIAAYVSGENELQRCAEQHGTPADRALIAAVLLALEVLPADPHA
jgi:hypothetical protein